MSMNSDLSYPRLEKNEGWLRLKLAAPSTASRVVEMPVVLDLDRYGSPIAFELISPCYYGGPDLFREIGLVAMYPTSGIRQMSSTSGIRFSYSDTDDVFVVNFDQDRSLDQCVVNGRLAIDAAGRLVAIEVPWENETQRQGEVGE
jgi:hypothetical protein